MNTYTRTLTIFCALLGLVLGAAPAARASSISIDFELPPGTGYDLFNGANQSTDVAHSGTYSAQLNDPVNQSLVRIIPSGFVLGSTSASSWVYLPTGTDLTVAPYMMFGVDVNGDNTWDSSLTDDALVIAFITGQTYSADTWFQTGLDANTKVQVVGNRAGLAAGTYDSSGTQDTLAALSAMSTGSGQWGGLALLRIYSEIGNWPGVDIYNSYVDDIQITSEVPEPTTMLLLGTGIIGLIASRRRRSNITNL